jgi:hypothetical protein
MLPDLENRVGSGAGSEDALHHPRDGEPTRRLIPITNIRPARLPMAPIIDHRRDQLEPGLRLLGR